MSQRFCVIGQPAHRSLSPRLFAWLFAHFRIDATYVAREVAPADLAAFVAEMRHGAWQGASVTAPHKIAVRELIDAEDDLAQRIGAVNTLAPGQGGVVGHNTDALGCRNALAHAGVALADANVVVLGSGGAARAAVFAALDGGARRVQIANRTTDRAAVLARLAGDARCGVLGPEPGALQDALNSAHVLIQSTSVGMGDPMAQALPEGAVLGSGLAVHDMVYRPIETALLRAARARGCVTVDGLWMLVYQGLRQFQLWTKIEAPPTIAAALHAHLHGAAH
jgi:shikimate dehydrogenase